MAICQKKFIALCGIGFCILWNVVLAADLTSVPAKAAADAADTLTKTTMGAIIVVQFLFMVWLILIIGWERKAEREERIAKDDKLSKSLDALTNAIRNALTADKISDKTMGQIDRLMAAREKQR